LALGTQTIGSVIRPASFCGCVGYKPTYERISREGVIPLSPSFDHVGICASNVASAELAASVLCRNWRPETASARWPVLGIPRGPYLEKATPEMLAHFRIICSRLADAGYLFKSIDIMPDFADIWERHYLITAADAARVHKNWFPRYRELYHPRTVELLERGQTISDESLSQALTARAQFASEVQVLMSRAGVDLWLSPSAIGAAPAGLESTGDPVMNLPWSQSGQPALNLPVGADPDGLPLGLQLVAQSNHDESLFGWAKDLEKVLRASHSN
jgi:Asp-tRNA(Asn)/Glu-tRNA(Gln) amidotransferase A subunit family amidase